MEQQKREEQWAARKADFARVEKEVRDRSCETPYQCPVCDGTGTVLPPGMAKGTPYVNCPSCRGVKGAASAP